MCVPCLPLQSFSGSTLPPPPQLLSATRKKCSHWPHCLIWPVGKRQRKNAGNVKMSISKNIVLIVGKIALPQENPPRCVCWGMHDGRLGSFVQPNLSLGSKLSKCWSNICILLHGSHSFGLVPSACWTCLSSHFLSKTIRPIWVIQKGTIASYF